MHTFDVGAIRRLAIVLGLFAGLAAVHMGLASPADAVQASVEPSAIAVAMPQPPRSEPGYGHASCAEGGCRIEYCAAPSGSDLGGYAVPCAPGNAG